MFSILWVQNAQTKKVMAALAGLQLTSGERGIACK